MAALKAALDRLRRWAKTLAQYMLVQSFAQAATIAAGIIIVRVLGKADYGYYTIANSWLAALVILSSGGVTDTATAIGGRVWDDPNRFGQVVRTAMRARRWLSVTAIVPIAGMLVWMLVKTGADTATVCSLTLLVALTGVCQIAYDVLVIVPRLKGNIGRLQYIDLVGAFLRLALTGGAAMAFLDARSAIAVSLVAAFVQYLLLRRWTAALIDIRAPVNDDVWREMRRTIARLWPSQIYFVFQSQISVVLLSIFGTVNGVADLGALNRIGVVFLVLGSVMQSIVLPRYAACQDARHLRSLYAEILIGFSLVALLPVAVAFVAPRPILWVLGPRYEHLSIELLLVAASAATGSISGLGWNLNTVRAWTTPWWLAVPLSLLAQIVLMLLIGVSTLRQVLLVGIFAAIIGILTNAGTTLILSRGFTRIGDRGRAFADLRGADDDAPPAGGLQ